MSEGFASQVGRQRMRFYFPKYETISKLEEIGTLVDNISVYYNEKEIPLINFPSEGNKWSFLIEVSARNGVRRRNPAVNTGLF